MLEAHVLCQGVRPSKRFVALYTQMSEEGARVTDLIHLEEDR